MGKIHRGAVALACLMALALAGCILSPGKFDATLNLRKDGHFTYSYTGQIYLLALSQLAQAAQHADGGGEFKPGDCYDDDFDERECTADDLAEQRATWDSGKAERDAKSEREAAAMKAMLGGIDPADPKAAEELAGRLRRQTGWKRVDYRGNGLFDVDFSISGVIDHDFVFPTLESFPMLNSFVVAYVRQGGQVRVEAPGFAGQIAGGNPLQSLMMAGMAGAALGSEGEAGSTLKIPEIDGTFRLITDGRVLTNNTDEGPRADPAGQVMEWRITPRSQIAPSALVQLGQ